MNRDIDKPSDDQSDSLSIEHLQKQLDDLEYQEIIKSLTDDDLKEKGILDSDGTNPEFKGKKYITDKEQLCFEPSIDFYRITDSTSFDRLIPEEYQFIDNVESKVLIATQKAGNSSSVMAGENVLHEITGETCSYYSKIKGKVLILNDLLCVLPADIDCMAVTTVSQDRLDAYADLSPGLGDGKALTVEFVKNLMMKQNITFGIIDNEIESAVEKVNNNRKTVKNIHIAHGYDPIPGKDGSIEYFFDYQTKEYDFAILPDGRIDYRNIKNIPMVKRDQQIARVIEPRDGTCGVDIFGKPLEAPKGRKAILTAGNGVTVLKDTNDYYAAIDGIIILNGSLIEVMESYIIGGDVDLSTGNIVFTGNVFVNGTILEGFIVKAGGDIIVSKNVESAHVEAGRDITVLGGIIGKAKSLVSAGRDVRAGYVQNARIEAQGDIIIKNFAVNSTLFTSGNLIIKDQKGSLIGGEAYAQKLIDLKSLGSPAGTKTYVELGTDFLLKRRISEIDEIISFCQQNITKLDNSLKFVILDAQKNKDLLISKKSIIKKAIDKKKELETRLKIISMKKYDLEKQQFNKDECIIKIRDNCYPDVIIRIREGKLKNDTKRMNIMIYFDRTTDEIIIAPG